MQRVQNAMRAERKKELYILSLDSGRLFWVVVISLLVLVFLFLLGYWIGHDTVAAVPNRLVGYGAGDPASENTLRNAAAALGQGSLAYDGPGLALSDGDPALALRAEERGFAARLGEEGKPPIEGESLGTKAEKTEFEALKQSKPAVSAPAQKAQTPAAAKKAEVVPRSPAAPAAAGASGKYQVQVASLSSRASAESLVKSLEAKQYRASIMETTVSGKAYYRVRVGAYDSYDIAMRVVHNLQDSGDGSGCYIVQN